MPKRSRAVFLLAFFLIGAGGWILYRWRSMPFHWEQFLETLSRVDYRWLTGSILLMLLSYLVRALRWEVMLRPLQPHSSLGGIVSATLIGFTAVVLLGRAGELVRPYLIALKERVPFSSQMAAWLLERILDSMVVLLIFGFALMRLPTRDLHLGPGLGWVIRAGGYAVAAICAICMLLLLAFRNFPAATRARIMAALEFLPQPTFRRVEEALGAFSLGMQSTRDSGFLVRLLAYTVLEWITIVAAYYALFLAFAATAWFGALETLTFVGFVSLGSIVQIPGIGGGVQVATVLVLTEIFGASLEAASGMAIFIWLLSLVVVVPFGLLCAFQEGINWKKFRHLPEDVPS